MQHALAIHSSSVIAMPGLPFPSLPLTLEPFESTGNGEQDETSHRSSHVPHPAGGVLEPAQEGQALQALPWSLQAAGE